MTRTRLTVLLVAALAGCQPRIANPEIVAAVSKNDAQAVAAYLEQGGDPNLTSNAGDPLLYIAAGPQGGVEVARLLIAGGADIEGYSSEGRTVLQNAAGWCDVQMVALLLDAGASLIHRGNDGRIPEEVVCKSPEDRRAQVLALLRGN